MLIQVRHNIEVAHRLFESLEPGNKCENIHGHSMWVELSLVAYRMNNGILVNHDDEPLEFGLVKGHFRHHLDTKYDHRLLLNANDPFAEGTYRTVCDAENGDMVHLPGLQATAGDPSTENIAWWIADWAAKTFHCDANVLVRETHVNAAAMGAVYVATE